LKHAVDVQSKIIAEHKAAAQRQTEEMTRREHTLKASHEQALESLATCHSDELRRFQKEDQARLDATAETAKNKLEEELKLLSARHAELRKLQRDKDSLLPAG
jgi:oligoendopeptidase F